LAGGLGQQRILSLTRYSALQKGVIVPHQLVKSIGDVMIISKAAVPSYNPEEEED